MVFTDKRKRIQAFWIGIILLAAGTLSFFYWGSKKQVWFCDEIYTYESANGFEQDWPASYVDEWMTGADVEAFFAADSEELSLNAITVRLYNDHVPLYFWLFRVVSFFLFRGSGTIWIGLGINLVFYLVFLGLAYGIFLRITERPLLSGAVIFLTCVVNRLMIEQATVLRMYMMLLLAELLLLLGALRILRESGGGRMRPGVFLYLFPVSVAGFLTHYHYWIFYAVTAVCFCGWLLIAAWRKQGRKFWAAREFRYAAAWAGNFAVSLLTTIFLFPYCRWNLNRGKGQTALYSLFDFSAEKGKQIQWGYERLSASLFGEGVPAAGGLLILFGCILGGAVILYRRKQKARFAGLVLVVLAAQAYQFFVCFTMPDAWEERYLWCVFTFMMLCAVWCGILLYDCLAALVREKMYRKGLQIKGRKAAGRAAALFLTAGIVWGELSVIDGGRGVAYLFHPEKDLALLQDNSSLPWIVYGPTVGVYSYYDWIIPDRICFLTRDRSAEDREAVKLLEEDRFVLYLYEDYLSEALAFFEEELGEEVRAQYLTRSTNLAVYLIEAGQKENTGEE